MTQSPNGATPQASTSTAPIFEGGEVSTAVSEAPETETEAPKTETEAPKAETEAPKAETEAPKAETESEAPKAETESEAPKAETEAPKAETEAPKAEAEVSTAEDDDLSDDEDDDLSDEDDDDLDEAEDQDDEAEDSEPTFASLGLEHRICATLDKLGYETPTAIQAAAIPRLLEGRDVLGQAQTGTGKTAAFALPMIASLDLERTEVQAIVLTPTRELAQQVAQSVRDYGADLGVKVLAVYGGQSYTPQLKALRRGVHVVIGTPGRVKDHLSNGKLDLSGVTFFGLDEADEMLNMGFLEEVEEVLDQAPEEKQVALFSATMPKPIRRIADRYQNDPVDVTIKGSNKAVERIEQLGLRVKGMRDKQTALMRLLKLEEGETVLVFAMTRTACTELAELLQAEGYDAECVHGGMTQAQREAVVRRLRAEKTRIVIATDVAARGLDVDHIGLVVNYDLPRDPEVYVHRIGRTGRAGREGRALSFWRTRERGLVRAIERKAGAEFTPWRLPSERELTARRRARFADKLKAIAQDEREDVSALVTELTQGEDALELARVAAAAIRMAWGPEPLELPPEPPRKKRERRERDERDEREPRQREGSRSPRENRRERSNKDEVEIVIPVGFRNRVRPGNIVGAIAGETGLPGSVVGSIRILDRVSFVAIEAEHVDKVLESLDGTQMGGREIQPRLAHPEGEDSGQGRGRDEEREERGDRRERRPFKRRDDRKPRSYDDRKPRGSSEDRKSRGGYEGGGKRPHKGGKPQWKSKGPKGGFKGRRGTKNSASESVH